MFFIPLLHKVFFASYGNNYQQLCLLLTYSNKQNYYTIGKLIWNSNTSSERI